MPSSASGKSFVWIKRQLTPRQQYEVNRLGIPGFQFEHEERRVYPFGDARVACRRLLRHRQ